MEEWQQRVICEKGELDLKVNALRCFMENDVYNNLDTTIKNIMAQQFSAMILYSSLLGERIRRF